MTMREWWANVSVVDGRCVFGLNWETRRIAVKADSGSDFRIHVRLKPEGAPARYRNGYERFLWENNYGVGERP